MPSGISEYSSESSHSDSESTSSQKNVDNKFTEKKISQHLESLTSPINSNLETQDHTPEVHKKSKKKPNSKLSTDVSNNAQLSQQTQQSDAQQTLQFNDALQNFKRRMTKQLINVQNQLQEQEKKLNKDINWVKVLQSPKLSSLRRSIFKNQQDNFIINEKIIKRSMEFYNKIKDNPTIIIQKNHSQWSQIEMDVICEFIQQIYPFNYLSRIQSRFACSNFKTRQFNQGDVIIQEGSYGDQMFIITKGKVGIYKLIQNTNKFLVELGRSDMLGEASLKDNEKRTASCIAHSFVDTLVYDRENYMEVYQVAKKKEKNQIFTFLQEIKALEDISDLKKGLLSSFMVAKRYRKMQNIYVEGDPATKGFLFKMSKFDLKVVIPEKQAPNHSNSQNKGMFGIFEVVNNVPRKTQIHCLTDCTVLQITKKQLYEALNPNEINQIKTQCLDQEITENQVRNDIKKDQAKEQISKNL